jgi:hypothetical protein
MILQAAVFEIVTEQVGRIPVPDWVFKEFAQKPETRNFSYAAMLFPEKYYVNHWGPGSSVPDITRLETRMWFYFLAASYIDIGVEAIHFGQLELIGKTDKGYRSWADLLQRVRRHAAKQARRHYVICDAHVPKAGPVVDGKLLLDVHSFPLRPKEIAHFPQKAELAVGYSDSLYLRSTGGVAPSGWKCEHLPYLVEFDNFGASRGNGGRASQTQGPSIWCWGYDEIDWFAHQPETYRNDWLRYAWNWLKDHDRDGHLQMPGGRMLADGPAVGGVKLKWYFANTKSPACPQGFNQEETIKAIWLEDSPK